MKKYHAIILDDFPKQEYFDDIEDFYDCYYEKILSYPLIMLPKNKIIFWGFEVTILKKEYELLKSIIDLNTKQPKKLEYTEEQIIKQVAYCQNNLKIPKKKAYQQFIKTSNSRIKRAIREKIVDCCVNRIEFNKFNPLVKGKLDDKKILGETKDYRKDPIFIKELLNSNINLTKIFTQMLNFTSPYNSYYSSFIPNTALHDLFYSPKGQQHNVHRMYRTCYIFNTEPLDIRKETNRSYRIKENNFLYAKISQTKSNLHNFVNYP